MQAMKVLIVNQHVEDAIGGSEIQCDLIAQYLTRFGYNVIYGAVRARRQYYDVNYHVVPLTNPVWKSLAELVRKIRPDVIYWRYNKHHLLSATLVARWLRVPLVFAVSHINDTRWFGPAKPPPKGSTIRRYLGWLYRRFKSTWNHIGFYLVQGVTFLNEDFSGRLPVKKQRVIHNSMSAAAAPFTWSKPFVLWVASLKPRKNPDVYIRLASKFPHIDFLMAGPIQNRQFSFVEDPTKLPPNVHYMGVVAPEVVNGMLRSPNCMSLVHTCDPEGFGNIFIQAWFQAKPTLSLYFDPEGIIEREKLGFIAGSFENLAIQLKQVLKDPSLRDEMGKRARIYANQHFAPEQNVKRLETFLTEIVDAYRPRQTSKYEKREG